MSSSNQKEVGDLAKISGGANKEKEGILQEKVRKGWNLKLQNGNVVLAAFPFIKIIAKKGEFEDNEPWKSILASEAETESVSSESEITAQDASENPSAGSDEEITTPANATSDTPENAESVNIAEIPDNLAQKTTVQLRNLAKQNGVSVARTKADFLRIIKEMNPDEDLERLKGKVLFDRVSELHISRLRSKEDLQKLLAQK